MRKTGLVLEFGVSLDMDCGRTTPQPRGEGADVEVVPNGTQLVVISPNPRAGAAWVDGLGPDDFDRCAQLADSDYLRQLDDLDKPGGEQRNICVRTGEDNLAIIDPDAPTTAGGQGFDLHYAIRYEHA